MLSERVPCQSWKSRNAPGKLGVVDVTLTSTIVEREVETGKESRPMPQPEGHHTVSRLTTQSSSPSRRRPRQRAMAEARSGAVQDKVVAVQLAEPEQPVVYSMNSQGRSNLSALSFTRLQTTTFTLQLHTVFL